MHALQRLLCIGHERAHIPPAHIGADNDAALAIFAADLIGAGSQLYRCDGGQRHKALAHIAHTGQGHGQAAYAIHIVAQRLGQAHLNIKAAVALKHGARRATAQRRADGVLHIAHI